MYICVRHLNIDINGIISAPLNVVKYSLCSSDLFSVIFSLFCFCCSFTLMESTHTHTHTHTHRQTDRHEHWTKKA